MVDIIFGLGLIGSITASSMLFPQVLASYKHKRTQDLSWVSMLISFICGVSWLFYGFLKPDMFVVATNIFFLIGVFSLMILKKKYG